MKHLPKAKDNYFFFKIALIFRFYYTQSNAILKSRCYAILILAFRPEESLHSDVNKYGLSKK